MQDYRININYAKALFLLAQDTHEQEQVAEDMRLVNQVCMENRQFSIIFRNPELKAAKKSAILSSTFESHISRTSMAFLLFVVRKSRSINLKGISAAYLDLYRESRGIVLSKLTTAEPSDESTRQLATQVIADYTHKQVELQTVTDPSIIGGMAIEFDNNLYDGTISSKIAKLRLAFDDNQYESKL
ncbi:MAG: ATP synthase F1 subunit delta [Bacteroidales bacterium]|nr:ATP synthase F1 subunit delta [Bacteroidales bacterium]